MGPDFAPILKIYFVVRRDRKGDLRFLEAHPRLLVGTHVDLVEQSFLVL